MVKRNSNIELLRLIAMAFITVHHFAIWGYFIGKEVHTVQPNTVWLQFLEIFGKIGVDLFILITGYFAINPRPTFQKVWQLTACHKVTGCIRDGLTLRSVIPDHITQPN